MKSLVLLFTVVILAGCSEPSNPDLTPVGVAKIDITPDEPVPLINELSTELSKGVAQPLCARAFAIGENPPVVLVGFDGIGVPAHLTEALAKPLSAARSIPRENVALAASHTHWAPHLTDFLPRIFGGPLPEDHQERRDRYTDQLLDRLEVVALEAIDSRDLMRLTRATGEVGFAANRRLEGDGKLVVDEEAGVMITENPDAPVDHSLPVWYTEDLDGVLRGIFFTYACHNVAITGRDFSGFKNQIHGDWVGLAQEEIESRHPECIALGLISAGGDQRPKTCGGIATAQTHADEIADETGRLFSKTEGRELVRGAHSASRTTVDLPLAPPPGKEVLKSFIENPRSRSATARALVAQRILSGEDKRTSVPLHVQQWKFGDGLTLLFLSGEVCVDYQLWLRHEFGSDVQLIAYSNDIPCYIVSNRMLEKGGYEAGNSMFYYGYLSPFSLESEEIIKRAVSEILAIETPQ